MRISSAIAFSSLALLLSGCASAPFATVTQTAPVPGVAIQGKVYGGQPVLVGASVYMYAANTTGYGNASVSLLKNQAVITNTDGLFNITGDYTCPSPTSQVYLYSIGGNSGSGPNSAAGLLAALGSCGTLSSSIFVTLNEVSTIATAYAIAGYATDALHVSSPSSTHPLAAAGIANAFAAAANLETLKTGVALATTPAVNGGNGTVPQSEINTLANILAACVNSTGPSSPSCTTLFTSALSGGTTGTQPTDTASAAINIAHNPGANIANLCGLQTATSPFQSDLSCAAASLPNDFTIAISYTGGGLDYPAGIAIDNIGDVWVTDTSGGSISQFSPVGVPLSGTMGIATSGLNDPNSLAIDGSGNVWVGSIEPYKVSEYNPSMGSWISNTSSGYAGSPFVIDKSGNIWTVGGSSVSELTSPGTGGTWNAFTGGGIDGPNALAIDASGNVWVSNFYNIISEFNSSNGTPVSSTGYSGGGLSQPQDIAIDANANVWLVNYPTSSLSEFCPPSLCPSSGSWDSPSSGHYTGGGLDYPYSLAIDGAGNIWTTNGDSTSISEFNSSGSPLSPMGTGYQGGGLQFPVNLAIDGSGNVWVPNSSNNTIVEFVGVAAPVVTPTVFNLLTSEGYGKYAVNLP